MEEQEKIEESKIDFKQVGAILGVLVLLIGAIVSGGGIADSIHVPSAAITFGVTFFILLYTFGTDFLAFLPNALLAVVRKPESNLRFSEIAGFAIPVVIGSGAIGSFIGFVQMLGNLQSPDKIGSGVAVALLTTMYGITAAVLVFMPLEKKFLIGDKVELSVTLDKKLFLRLIVIPACVIFFGFYLLGMVLVIFTDTHSVGERFSVYETDDKVLINESGEDAEVTMPTDYTNVLAVGKIMVLKYRTVIKLADPYSTDYFSSPKENSKGMYFKIKATILSQVSGRDSTEFMTAKGKKRLTDDIKKALSGLLPRGKDGLVSDVYFSELLVMPLAPQPAVTVGDPLL